MIRAIAFAALLGFVPSSVLAQDIVTNGNFAAGLAGWTVYNTTTTSSTAVAGTSGPATATTFDVTGTGTQSTAQLQVGDFDGPFDQTFGGGGLRQTVASTGGNYAFAAAVAAFDSSAFTNVSAGHFAALIDGVILDEVDFDTILSGQTLRGALSFTTQLAAGAHVLSLQATRNGLRSADTPYQYFTNVSLVGNAGPTVPEPATWAMMIAGFGLVGGTMRRRRTGVAFA